MKLKLALEVDGKWNTYRVPESLRTAEHHLVDASLALLPAVVEDLFAKYVAEPGELVEVTASLVVLTTESDWFGVQVTGSYWLRDRGIMAMVNSARLHSTVGTLLASEAERLGAQVPEPIRLATGYTEIYKYNY